MCLKHWFSVLAARETPGEPLMSSRPCHTQMLFVTQVLPSSFFFCQLIPVRSQD